MGNTVAFDYATFILRYPEFQSVTAPLACMYFNEACLYLDNTPCGMVPAGAPTYQRDTFLLMLTAFVAAQNAPINGQPSSPLVGRITDASEGSVSVKVAYTSDPSMQEAFFTQNKYGAAYWTASAAYRTGFYVPGPIEPVGVYGVYNGVEGFMSPWNGPRGW